VRRGASPGLPVLLVLGIALLAALPLQAAAPQAEGTAAHGAAGDHAAEGGGEHGGGHADTWLGLPRPIFLTINLILFFGILVRFAGPALVRFVEEKQREIQHALAEAGRQRTEAAQMETRLAGQIAELRREVEELAARSEREAERERVEILAEAERERQRLEAAARNEIEQGLLQAQQRLTAHAATLATRLAEERISGGLTREDRKRLFRENLAKLETRKA
jgi:F-type H+-transporting ATPase subunit b